MKRTSTVRHNTTPPSTLPPQTLHIHLDHQLVEYGKTLRREVDLYMASNDSTALTIAAATSQEYMSTNPHLYSPPYTKFLEALSQLIEASLHFTEPHSIIAASIAFDTECPYESYDSEVYTSSSEMLGEPSTDMLGEPSTSEEE